MDVRTGTIIAGFRVESLLGEGAMGTVYLAEETMSGRRVALKLLAPELASDERFRARFLRETELAASLDHPHVVPTLASGEKNGTLYLAMAHVEGADLRKLLRSEGRFDPERAILQSCPPRLAGRGRGSRVGGARVRCSRRRPGSARARKHPAASTASSDTRPARAGSRAPTGCDREARTGRGLGRAPRRA